jgi:hypothetical protein
MRRACRGDADLVTATTCKRGGARPGRRAT